MKRKIISAVLLISVLLPSFRAQALFFSKSDKHSNTKTNEVVAEDLINSTKNLIMENGTISKAFYELIHKEVNKTIGAEIENLKAEFKSLKEVNEKFYGVFLCIGILIGIAFAGPAWQLLDVATRQISLWSAGVFGIEQLNRRVGRLENSHSFLESRIDGLSNLVNRLKNK